MKSYNTRSRRINLLVICVVRDGCSREQLLLVEGFAYHYYLKQFFHSRIHVGMMGDAVWLGSLRQSATLRLRLVMDNSFLMCRPFHSN
jgi:hypothetical protein